MQDGDGNPNGCEWLPIEQVGTMMCQELGYEDEPEFEDALKGSWSDFLDKLPHITKKDVNGRWAAWALSSSLGRGMPATVQQPVTAQHGCGSAAIGMFCM